MFVVGLLDSLAGQVKIWTTSPTGPVEKILSVEPCLLLLLINWQVKFNQSEERRRCRTHRWCVTVAGRIRWYCWLICIREDYQKGINEWMTEWGPYEKQKRKLCGLPPFTVCAEKEERGIIELIMWGLWPFLVNFPGFVWGKDVTLILELWKEKPNRERHRNPWP